MEYIKKGVPQYKANLHSHTVLSDGKLTPEQMKQAYRDRGYSILAITDHEHPVDHSDLTEPDFLMLTGYEAYIRTNQECRMDIYAPEIHINLLARDPHNTAYINFNESYCKYIKDPEERAHLQKVGSQAPREYTVSYGNQFIQTALQNGYICAYNHPVWSMEDLNTIMQYKGLFSMEMCNYSSYLQGHLEYNGALYDTLLRKGRHLFTHSSDDNHNKFPFDSPRNDSFGGFTMILSDALTYDSVFHALETGRFYSSMGPLIHALTIEGKNVHIETSSAQQITMHYGTKRPLYAVGTREEPVTQADFVIPEQAQYVRFSVCDFEGKFADTRGFFREELDQF